MHETNRLTVGLPPQRTWRSSVQDRSGLRQQSSLACAACAVLSSSAMIATGYSPRAKTTNVRTREHLRRWGIADALRKASPISPDRPLTVVFATRMNGHFLTRFENALHGSRDRNNLYSRAAQWVPQYVLEDVLRTRAQSLPSVRIYFETEFLSLAKARSEFVVPVQGSSRRPQHRRQQRVPDRRRWRAQRGARGDRREHDRRRCLFTQLQHHLPGAGARRTQCPRTGHHVLDGQ